MIKTGDILLIHQEKRWICRKNGETLHHTFPNPHIVRVTYHGNGETSFNIQTLDGEMQATGVFYPEKLITVL